ncbi:MAG: hypothetical protein A2000_02300 [Ignavibacteria bacterium GWB2_36_8]|nr:MAG: hypothetical protein A2000_02300 [Ignavibacteria bacterium GWB2_36_8]OGU49600.1 MAG: hypothetical protein A2080_13930 [Ignavibacteria bacterium GWC2_36_12]
MNTKRLLITALVVFVLLEVMSYLIHGVILASTYQMDEVKVAFRPEEEMMGKMWIVYVTDIIWSFFFAFFFAKGYEGKGIMEGLRFGFYIGLFWSLVSAYQSYAFIPMPYSLSFQWFIYGMIQALILGIVASLVYKPAKQLAAA